MSGKGKAVEKGKAEPAASTSAVTGGTYASRVRNPSFGTEAKDSQPTFEIRLVAPQEKLSTHQVIQELSKGTTKSSLFGVRFLQRDIIASFHDEQERNRLVTRGSIKVRSTTISITTFPLPPSLGTKHFLCDIPMTATGTGVAKGLEPVAPTKWLFEHYNSTHVRTGRVIFWTKATTLPEHLRVVDIKCPIKTPGKAKKTEEEKPVPESKEADKEQQRGAPLAESDVEMMQAVAVKVPAASTLEAPIVPDAQIFKKAVLEAPARPALLSIYEGLTKKGDAEPANALVPTTLDNVTKTQSRVDHPDGTYDLYALSTFESDSGAVKALEKLKSNFKGDTKAWEMQGWVHYVSAPSGAKVLVIYKSRIANSIKK